MHGIFNILRNLKMYTFLNPIIKRYYKFVLQTWYAN